MKRKVLILSIAAVIGTFVLFPAIVSRGAAKGLLLWFNVIFPALLPFMILSGVIVRMGITSAIGRAIYPVMHLFFRISKNGCYPVVVGLLSGYPLGAKTVSDMCSNGSISKKEGQFLISFCNNASPMFLLEYIGVYCIGMKQPVWVLVVVYLSAFLSASLEFLRRGRVDYEKMYQEKPTNLFRGESSCTLIEALDKSILDSFVTLAKVGGYIILFSICVQLFQTLFAGNTFLGVIGVGTLEITTGAEAIRGITETRAHKWIAGIGICAFGGFSSIAQTSSVIQESGLSTKKYIAAKIRHAVVAVALAALLQNML